MGFVEAIKHVFSNYANFSGRARRSEYWYWTLFTVIVSLVLGLLGGTSGDSSSVSGGSILSSIFSLAVLVPGLAVCWRRLHDIGKSGGYYFLVLIPLVGAIILFVWFCRDSDPGTNQYGPNPKMG